MSDDITHGSINRALLEELRLLRQMGEDGRAAAALALRSARLASVHPDRSIGNDAAIKFALYELDAAVVARGGGSIFDCKPRGTLSAEAERRFEAWVSGTPRGDGEDER